MRLTCYQPYRLSEQFQGELDRLMNATPRNAPDRSGRWTPAFDVLENEVGYLLRADLPGVERGNIDISLENSILTIKGERKPEHTGDSRGYRRRERRHGQFLRQYTLPDSVDSAGISARMSNGVLEISIPKQASHAPRKITLN